MSKRPELIKYDVSYSRNQLKRKEEQLHQEKWKKNLHIS